MVAAVDMPGTNSVGIPGISDDGETRYTLDATIGVKGTATGVALNKDSFRADVSKTTPLGGLSFTAGNTSLSMLSLTNADNVELTYTLHGPIDSPKTFTDDLGDIRKITGSEQSQFTARNLPCGNYVLHMDLYWDGGHDYHREDVQIACGGDNR